MQQSLEAAELIDERPDERLDTSRLEPYLRTHLEGAEGSLSVRQFAGGKANLTYLLRFTPTLGALTSAAQSHHKALPLDGGGSGGGEMSP